VLAGVEIHRVTNERIADWMVGRKSIHLSHSLDKSHLDTYLIVFEVYVLYGWTLES
jgi:hypothetical protein